ncbi:protein MIZU-KUSSEI 1 [Cucumis melo var. makuwa]|uniref:Protein MIZU-KUSSEI 1 n=2 Tax=Cucumis melo TaxID=3656 RepID=A0A5A7VFP8_CUCMM|nr:protein MIZU-KUSSEI 1 [Cucumis melo var. makuwa]TYK20228.1 protein MIZU-KUSSEI 1 [Cucumis melo var. makuwa]
MPSLHSSPFMDNSAFLPLLRHITKRPKSSSSSTTTTGGSGGGGGGLLKMFKLFPMLTSGCKMVALLGRPRKPLLKDNATTGTIFGYRKGRVSLAIQEDPHCLPIFVIELPMQTAALNKEMASDILRIALESETKSHKKKVMEEFVWAVYCNGRKIGYSFRRKQMSDDELHVMQHLRGVSMGAGVLPSPASEKDNLEGELTYMRARFERVIGSKDSEALYMINPDGAPGPELSIFFVRSQ